MDTSSSRSSRARKAEIARKRAELASIREEHTQAELDALEADDDDRSKSTNRSHEHRVDRLRRVGLLQDDGVKDETTQMTTSAECPSYGQARSLTGQSTSGLARCHGSAEQPAGLQYHREAEEAHKLPL